MNKDFHSHFKDKKITVLGLGLLGRGVGDVAYLAEAGADLIVTDLKSEAELAASLEKLKDFKNITYTLGEHRKEDFEGRDMILVGPKVPKDSEYVEVARAVGTRIVQSAALFAKMSGIPIIGVTGTRGKSTVTQMIHHVLSVTTGEHIILGGNIRGVSNLQLLKDVKEDSIAVMELDSWQLQGFGWEAISPQIAVFTNFMEDHLDYYSKSVPRTSDVLGEEKIKAMAMDAYFADKANIFKFQEESGVLVTTPEVFDRAKSLPGISLGQEVVLADASVIPEDAHLAMPGEHNRLNAALAYEALKAVSLSDAEIFEGLASFPGVEGRLQLVQTIDLAPSEDGKAGNVRIYNDNNSTTPQATVAALRALDLGDPAKSGTSKNIVLICGGADKNIPLDDLVSAINKHCKQVITIPGNGTDRLLDSIHDIKPLVTENVKEAFEEARLVAENGDIILFSPAFASFGQYNNEYERNDAFMSLIATL